MPRIDYATCTRPNYGHYPPPHDAVYLGKLALEHAVNYLALRGIGMMELFSSVADMAMKTLLLGSAPSPSFGPVIVESLAAVLSIF